MGRGGQGKDQAKCFVKSVCDKYFVFPVPLFGRAAATRRVTGVRQRGGEGSGQWRGMSEGRSGGKVSFRECEWCEYAGDWVKDC